MTKKKFGLCVTALAMLVTACFGAGAPRKEASAAEAEPLGLLTRLSLTLDGGNGDVWATVKNEFTLFPATVTVYLELYYSYEYRESYTQMTYSGEAYIYDLDMGETLQYSASTEGKQRYWKARIHYKVDSDDWKEELTNTALFDEIGNHISC